MEVIEWANDEGETLQLTRSEAEQLMELLKEVAYQSKAEGDGLDVEITD